MVHKCNECGEEKLCRKLSWGYCFEWRCKDCDDFFDYLFEKRRIKREKEKKEFVKHRDKVLAKIRGVKNE